ncbi:MAG: glycosyltransferase family 2 protein [Patescibacteria group bacterium]|jgi:hypothetical protein
MFDVVVVIVNFNGKEQIDRCLASLYSDIKISGLNVKVVVVDNASSDGSIALLSEKYPEAEKLLLQENRGFGAAQNIGLKSVKANYYFVLNPDTFFFSNESVLRKLYNFMEKESSVGMAGPKIVYPDGALQLSCYRFPTFWHPLFTRTRLHTERGKKYHRHLTMKDVEHNFKRPVDWLMGSAMFIRGAAFEKVGYFDERFWMYYEDSDLCRRFWENNLSVYYFPEAKIEHVHGRGSASEPKVIKALFKNKLARVHILSWLKYMWKWRGNFKYYAIKI